MNKTRLNRHNYFLDCTHTSTMESSNEQFAGHVDVFFKVDDELRKPLKKSKT